MARKPKAATEPSEPAKTSPEVQHAAPKAAAARNILRKKDFLDLAIARAGIRKSDARTAIDATLATLAEALSMGQDVVIPPLGKLRVLREKPTKQGRVLMLRLTLDAPASDDAEPLAGGADQG